ncbi:MAG: hypothetical protein V1907_00555 [Candidatus Kerfeldbacteria bacterium]
MLDLRNWAQLPLYICDIVAWLGLVGTIFVVVIEFNTRRDRWMNDWVSDWLGWREVITIMMLIVVTVRLSDKPHDWLMLAAVPVFLIGTYILIPLLGRKQRIYSC